MPKVVATPKTRRQINEESMARRGIVHKAFKIHQDYANLFVELAEKTGKSQAQILCEAITLYAEQIKD